MRVIVDTNLFVSHLLYPKDADRSTYRIVEALRDGHCTHVLAIELLQEMERVVSTSEYLSQRIRVEDVQRLRTLLLQISEVVTLVDVPIIPVLRDPKDDYLLTASWKFSVDCLVTGDRDLLDVRDRIDSPSIVTAAEFLGLALRARKPE